MITSKAIHGRKQRVGVGTPKEVMVPVQKRSFFAPTDASMSGSNGNGLQKSAAEQYPPRRIVQAIQQHPPLRGKNAYLEAKNFDQLQVGMFDKLPSLNTAKNTVQKPGLEVHDVLHKTELKRNVHRRWNMEQGECSYTKSPPSRAIHAGRQRVQMPTVSKSPHQVGVATPKEVMVPVQKRSFFAPTDASMSGSNGNGLQKSAAEQYPPRRIVQAIQQHPPLSGKNAYLEAKNFDQLQVGMCDKLPSLNTAKNTVQKPGLDVHDVLHKTELKRNVHRRWNMEQGECSYTKSPPSRAIHAGRQRVQMPTVSKSPHQVGVATPKEVMVPVQKRNFFSPSNVLMSVSNGNGLQKSAAKKYPPRRIVEAIQNHPLCGKNAYLEAKNFDQLQVGMGDKPPSSNTAKTTVKKPGLKLQDVELHRTDRRWNTKSPPTCQQSSTSSRLHDNHPIDIRSKVRETLQFFKYVVTSLEGEKPKEGGPSHKRLDFQAAKILKDKGMYVNTGKQIIGPVPGVEVGDEFHYRVELTIIGLHRQTQAGIDFVKHGGKNFATSIVSSGNYEDDFSNESSIIYTGHGGNYMLPSEKGYDQKLERGNLALKNSLEIQNPIRVIHRFKSSVGRKTFVYKGLYKIKKFIRKRGNRGKLIWQFHLERVLESFNKW